MKKIITIAFLLLSALATNVAFAKCVHDSDTASDGSRCGGRSSDSRPGGK